MTSIGNGVGREVPRSRGRCGH